MGTPATPQHQQFNSPMPSPAAMPSPGMPSPASGPPQSNQMNSAVYDQHPINLQLQQQQMQQQYPQQYPQQQMMGQQQQQQMYGPMIQQQSTRFTSNVMGPQGAYNMG